MTVAFKTFGCRLNRAETAGFEAAFAESGVTCVPFKESADIVVLHTCAVTQTAEDECLRTLRALRRKRPYAFLVVAGCAVEAVVAEALKTAGADLVVARGEKESLARVVLTQVAKERTDLLACEEGAGRTMAREPRGPTPRRPKRALLKIQDGCDFFCTYCIVPHTRGLPHTRPFDECLREAEGFIADGYREIVVTGCNVACYADRGRGLVDLLSALARLPGLGRLRLGSIEPGTVEEALVAFMASTSTVCRFLHLAVQSGDNGVLTRMGRRYTVAQLEATVLRAQELMPDVAFGADLICGFPGETQEAFTRTVRLVETLPFSNLHVFPYSERPGTPACDFDGRVPWAERHRRTQQLIAAGRATRAVFARRFLGQRVECLIERFDSEGRACGWSGEYLPCVVTGMSHDRLGQLCAFVPDRVADDTLCGGVTV